MNIQLNYPLERFLIWLTGNDKNISVVIDETIAASIKQADPDEQLSHVETLQSGCIVVYWKESWIEKQYSKMTNLELVEAMTNALAKGDLMTVKTLQQKLTSINV